MIVLTAPGLYALSGGFYSSKKPRVSILVNNEIAITINGTSSGPIQLARHSAGNICGLTINEFVALPARARISFSFECSDSTSAVIGEGFFQLRKL